MDYRRINSHMILLGMVIVVGLFAAIIVRLWMLERGADGGTANLIFVLILGASAVLYLIIISTLSNSVIPWIMRRLPAPKKKAGLAHFDSLSEDDNADGYENGRENDRCNDGEAGQAPDYGFAYPHLGGGEEIDESDEHDGADSIVDSGEEETDSLTAATPAIAPTFTPALTPTLPRIDWKEQHEREFQERLAPFREYTHFAMGQYVSEVELARLDGYVELFAREVPLPSDITPIRPERLKNPDLYHFGWNMQNYFKVGKREDAVPWLQKVFAPLKDLEFSTIKGKLHDPQTRRHTIPNIDDIPKFMAEKRS